MAAPLAIGAIGSSVVGSLFSAAGAQQQGQAANAMYQYQAGVANLNSQLATRNANLTLAAGEEQLQQYGMAAAQRKGAIRAGESASGIDIGSGSKAAVQDSQQLVTSIDERTISNNAANKAYNYTVESAVDTAQAGAYTAAGANALAAGELKADASLISGVGSVADKWLQGSSVGLFGGGGGTAGGSGSIPNVYGMIGGATNSNSVIY